MTKVYSRDDEWFDYEELHTLVNDNELVVGDTVYEGEAVAVQAGKLFDACDLMECIGERMYDQVGEAADDWPCLNSDERSELGKDLEALIEKHFKHSFYKVVNVQERKITKEDLE
jgi:hypothetical protein